MSLLRTLIVGLLVFSAGLQAQSKLSPDLASVPPSSSVKVIVQYKISVQSNRLLLRLPLVGGILRNTLDLVKSVVVELTGRELQNLANDPDVEYISLDRPVQGSMEYAYPTVYADAAARAGFTGAGVTVAVIDSGVESHQDLRGPLLGISRVVYSESFVKDDKRTGDSYGHGTHVAGIVAGHQGM